MAPTVGYFADSPAAALAGRLPPPYDAVSLEEGASDPPHLVLVGGPEDVARAVRLAGGDRRLLAVTGEPAAAWVVAPLIHGWLPPDAPPPLVAQALDAARTHLDLARTVESLREDLVRKAHELRELAEIGTRLSAERDLDTLLEAVLTAAREMTAADAGSLYLVEPDEGGGRRLRFALVQNDSLPTTPLPALTLPVNAESVAGHAALTGEVLDVADAYALPPDAPFRVDRSFDQRTGYRTRSMLVVPMKNPKGDVLGVLQLINARAARAPRSTLAAEVEAGARPFPAPAREVAVALASQAAVAVENARLYADLRAALRAVEDSQRRIVQGERLRALGEMAGGVAHDFNNVLAVVIGRAQLLLQRVTDPEIRRQLVAIEQVGQDGAGTVRRMQEFTRMRKTRPFRRVDLARVVEEVVEAARPRWVDEARTRGIAWDVRLEAAPVPPVLGDPVELRECVTNLFLNALDAMPGGGRVVISTGADGQRVVCTVADTGIGMTEEVRRRLFEPFFTTKADQGSGLGLSITYGIVTRHGGEIEVWSRPGEGSRFVVRLPMAPEAEPGAPEPGEDDAPARRARILVVDDEPRVREVLVDLLVRQGHEVVACGDGEAALTHLAGARFDLVLLDLSMPGLSGWEVARRARLGPAPPPVALVTGWGDQIDPALAREHGVEHVLAKPFDLEAVNAVVAQTLARAGRSAGRPA